MVPTPQWIMSDISNGSDHLLHKELICKMYEFKGGDLKMTESFLFERQQGFVLNGQETDWMAIKAGMTQDSVLRQIFLFFFFFFFAYINYLTDNLGSNLKLFVYDTSIFLVVD